MLLLLYIITSLTAIFLIALLIPVQIRIHWINNKLSLTISYFRFSYQSDIKKKDDAIGTLDTIESSDSTGTKTTKPIDSTEIKDKKAKKEKVEKKKRFDGLKLFSCGKEIKVFLGWMVRSLRRIFSIPHWQPVEGYLQIGGEDPALIGMLYGYGCSVQPLLPSKLTLRIFPDFEQGRWEFSLSGGCTIRPIRVLWVLFRILLDFPLLSGIRLYRKTRIRHN